MKTTSDRVTFSLAVILSVGVAVAAAWLCYADTDHPWRYRAAIAILGVGWGLRHVLGRKSKNEAALAESRRKIEQAIVMATLMLSLALIARLGWVDGFSDFGARSRGFMAGAMVVFLSNTIPKQAGSARALAMRRAVGWAMVLGGLGHALAWLLLPMAYAGEVAVFVMLLAVGWAAVRFFRFVYDCRSNPSAGAG